MSRFVHLHTHSHYSFLEALPKVDELVLAAKKAGMTHVALTDSGNLHGAIEFYKSAVKQGITPIIGVDAYVAPRSRFEQDRNEKRSRLVLLAETMEGYKNLLALVSASYLEGLFEKPRVDRELLKKHAEGLIAIIPSLSGDVALALSLGDTAGASASLEEYKNIFGTDNLFLEITHHPKISGHEERMRTIGILGKASGVRCVAQQDVYYVHPEDKEARTVMGRIQDAHRAKDVTEEDDFSFIDGTKALALFSDMPEAVDESKKIAERCKVELTLGNWIFPEVKTEEGKTHGVMLREKAYAGLSLRGIEDTPETRKRIDYELSVIDGKGYAPYFLAVADLLSFAKKEGILSTTRGSAAGSLVSYLTFITNVNPLFYKLPFERFLNPERPKAPDIDMDYADNRRGEMIAYAKRTYGEDRVAQIGTFGTMMARAAVRDVARALGHPYGMGDRIAKLIPLGSQGFPMTIDHALQIEEELRTLYEEDEDVAEIIDLAKRIEGCVRHVGVHAAGVVVAPSPLTNFTPVQFDPKGSGALITQYDMYSITDEYGGVGLLKFDFLGIKNLAVLADAVARVKETRSIAIDIENIPLDDPKTFAMLARGETEGLFQLNGSGMTRYLKELQPTSIFDINAMVALYRPGPMESIPSYIAQKRNPKLIRYLDPRLEAILGQSYGVVAYQDDVLLIAIELGGYSWLEADALRKAMGKKIPEEMEAQKEKLIAGFMNHGKLSADTANKLFKLIEPFAAYGFNKAHAASYGKVAYQTGYMKANYPVPYMAALLSADAGDTDEIAKISAECERLGIPVLPPDINESDTSFTVTGDKKDTIRFGLGSIKNFGEGIATAIMDERKKGGLYKTLGDFLARVGSKNLNRKSLESLIKCGALDRFGGRAHLLSHIETLLAYHKDASQEAPQDSLFGTELSLPPDLVLPKETQTTTRADRLTWEKELLGIYVSGHPLDEYEEKMGKAKITIAEIKEEPHPGLPVVLPVMISDVRSILTKKGEKMAFLKLEDKTGSFEAVIFPKLHKEHGALIHTGSCVLIKGTVSNRNGELSLALENIKAL
jgi:DNA polymerase-3 subunit alpha